MFCIATGANLKSFNRDVDPKANAYFGLSLKQHEVFASQKCCHSMSRC